MIFCGNSVVTMKYLQAWCSNPGGSQARVRGKNLGYSRRYCILNEWGTGYVLFDDVITTILLSYYNKFNTIISLRVQESTFNSKDNY